MSMAAEMARVETLAKRGYDAKQIKAAGIQVNSRTISAIVVRVRPAPTPEQIARAAAAAEVERWRIAEGQRAVGSYRIIIVRGIGAITIRQIISETAAKHGMTSDDLLAKGRLKPLVTARHEAIFRAAKLTPHSFPVIGQFFGGLDHSTVINAIRVHASRHGLPLPRGMQPKPRRAA
jgi:chromosomal replication initiation ATPase DnaA